MKKNTKSLLAAILLLWSAQLFVVLGFSPLVHHHAALRQKTIHSKHWNNQNNIISLNNKHDRRIISKFRRSMSSSSDQAIPPPSGGNRSKRERFAAKMRSLVPTATERQKLIPLALMFFCILFNYTILRDTKDVLMITAPRSGAEVMPFIKTYCNLPSAIGFTAVYANLCDNMELKNVFYACVIPFLVFFALFATVIYPSRGFLHPMGFADFLATKLPLGFSAPIAMLGNWTFVVFYVMAEMWGSVVTSLLFWGVANEVTTVEEAKKYYPLFGLGANVALIFSGQYTKWVASLRNTFAPGVDPWTISLRYLMGAVIGAGTVMLGAYKYLQDNVVAKDEELSKLKRFPIKEKKVNKKKNKMSMMDSLKFLGSSSYIRNLAILVMAYGLCINLVEVSWKANLKQAFPNPNDYAAFMGNFSSVTGIVTLIMMLLGRTVFQKFGWKFAAMVTPTMIGVTGLGFYGLTMFPGVVEPLTGMIGVTPIMLAVLVGAAQNILSKSSKYSLFDPCKEMAYIPLDKESKTKGKAAIDVIGNPLGKSGGALIQQILIFSVGSLAAATPYLSVLLAAVVFLWYRSVNSLSIEFETAMKNEEAK